MSENFVSEQKNKWCIYCKNPIIADQPYITIDTYDGDNIYYHKYCYDLMYPPEGYKELDFGH